jgi:two-component system, cell cycle sensor histidine kinase and response regulator CckA
MPKKPTYDELQRRVAELEAQQQLLTEIANRKQAEAKYQTLFREMLDGFALHEILCDEQGNPFDYRFLAVNPAFERITGLKAESLIGQTVLKVLPDIEWHWIETYGKVALTGEPFCFESYAAALKKHFQITAFQPAPRQFACIFADITERKQTEEKLRESWQIIEGILNAMPVRVFWKDKNLVFCGCNAAFARDAGFTDPQDLIGKSDYQMGWRDQAELYRSDDRQVIESGCAKILIEEPQTTPEGNTITLLTSKIPLRGSTGEINGILGTYLDITDRKLAEDLLLENNEIFSLFMRHSPVYAYIKEVSPTESRVLQASDNFQQMIGISGREMKGKTMEELFPAGLAAKMTADDWSVVEKGEAQKFDEDLNGRNYTSIKFPIVRRGKALLAGYTIDITERKQAEERLHASELKFSKLFHSSPDAILVTELTGGRIIEVNESFLKLSGYSRDELIGHPVLEFDMYGPNDRQRFLFMLREHSSIQNAEFKLKNKATRELQILASAELIELNKEPHAITILRDNTEHKQAEDALRESEEKLRRMFELMPNSMTLQTMEGILLDCNDTFCETTGFARPEVLGRTTLDVGLWTDIEQRNTMREMLRRDGRVDGMEIQLHRRDGQIRIIRLSSRIMPRDPEPIVLAVAEDITDRRHAEEDKDKLQAQLQQAQKMESVGRLAGGVAHDFNNMLGVIIGHSEMALGQIDPTQPLHDDLTEISNAAHRSADLTRQLLAFARRQTVTPRVLDLNETVSGMLKMMQRIMGENIELRWHPSEELWPVKIDPSQIDQILANLCVNARDAIKGIGKVTVETQNSTLDETYCATHTGSVPGEYVRLTVSDNGCGMDKETLAQIFEPFFTTKDIGKGTGLGLATVYGAVKQNNGFIDACSELGKGATFTIYLSRHVGKPGEAARTESTAAPVKSGHETILLVEDESSILKMATRALEMQGYAVLPASTPGEAIQIARDHHSDIHLLITDVVLPEMNGRNLAANLLALYPNLKCLFMSGYTADIIAHSGVLDEGVYFIQKPFSSKDLASKIRSILDSE